MATCLQDLRFGLRHLLHRPGFALVAVAALALGIGCHTAIFSVVDGVLLKPLPAADPDRLQYVVLTRLDKGGHYSVPYHNMLYWRERSRSFESLTAMRPRTVRLRTEDGTDRLVTTEVAPGYFETLGVAPALGRAFRENDRGVAILGHRLWRNRFGSDPEVLGRLLDLDGEPHEVVGVMPPAAELSFLGIRDLWTPLEVDEAAAWVEPLRGFQVLARIRNGISPEAARRDLDRVAAELAEKVPATNDGWGIEMRPARWWIVGSLEAPLALLAGAGLLVLLVACATVATLISSLASARRREIAVRRALGAGRGRLVRQLVCESLLVSLAGGVLGCALAAYAVELLPAWVSDGLPRLEDVRVDLRTLSAGLAASIAAGLLSGLLPALGLTRRAAAVLHPSGARQTGERAGLRTRQLLVAGQVTLAMVAVTGSGLLVRSLLELRSVDAGFEPRGLLTFRVEAEDAEDLDNETRIARFEELLARLEALPGVERAGAAGFGLPPRGSTGTYELFVEGQPRGPRPDVIVSAQTVSSGYFETLAIPLVAGRGFVAGETWETAHAVIVNQTLARRYWPGEDPVGRWVEWQTGDRGTIVGAVGDVRELGIRREPGAIAYLPWVEGRATQHLALRTSVAPLGLMPDVRRVVRDLMPGTPIFAVRTGEDLFRSSYSDDRFATVLMSVFAFLAQALGLLGVYSVLAHSVSRRTREIGVRMALGALPAGIVRWTVGRGLRPVGVGLAVGASLSLAVSRLWESQLYGVSVGDPVTLLASGAWILLAALAICTLPARRAARTDPASVLRAD